MSMYDKSMVAFYAALDDEQRERNERTDLCDECRPMNHMTCGMHAECACCRTTIVALAEEEGDV